MKIALMGHKGDVDTAKHRFVSKVIKWWRKISHSHVELFDLQTGLSFSSRGMDEPKGVGWKKIGYSNPARWDRYEIEVVEWKYKILIEECKKYIGCKYDGLGIFGSMFLPFGIHNRKKFFCSEVLHRVLDRVGLVIEGKDQVDPDELILEFLQCNQIINSDPMM